MLSETLVSEPLFSMDEIASVIEQGLNSVRDMNVSRVSIECILNHIMTELENYVSDQIKVGLAEDYALRSYIE